MSSGRPNVKITETYILNCKLTFDYFVAYIEIIDVYSQSTVGTSTVAK